MNASHARRIRIGVVTAYRTYHGSQQAAEGWTTRDDLQWRAYRRTMSRLDHGKPQPIGRGWRP